MRLGNNHISHICYYGEENIENGRQVKILLCICESKKIGEIFSLHDLKKVENGKFYYTHINGLILLDECKERKMQGGKFFPLQLCLQVKYCWVRI
jgi:hypothetical protein